MRTGAKAVPVEQQAPLGADARFDHEERQQEGQQHFDQDAGRGKGHLLDHRRGGHHLAHGRRAGHPRDLAVHVVHPGQVVAQFGKRKATRRTIAGTWSTMT
jgi:hypothetical protein